jgi:hypothetical protein
MLFERFLKRRQKETFKQEDQSIVAERALHHPDPAVRREAIRHLEGLAPLRLILTEDTDAGAREIAAARYRQRLCAAESATSLPLADQLAEVAQLQDQRLIEQLAVQALAPEVRRVAIERVESTEILVACTVQDPLAANRGAAVERLVDKASLEQVLRQIGKRDKTVYRTARDKLREITEREERPGLVRARCEELCEKVERLGRLEHWHQDRALLDHLDRRWAEIRDEAEPEWQARYTGARERFLQALGGHARETAARIATEEAYESLHAQRLALLEALTAAPTLDSAQAVEDLRARVAAEWEALDALPPERQRPLEQRYQTAMAAAEAAKARLTDERKRQQRLRSSVQQAQVLIDESKPLNQRQTKTFIASARELLSACADAPDAETLRERLERLDARLATQRRHAEQRLEQLPGKLTELEQHLSEGELKKADPLFQSLRAGLELVEASGLPKSATAEINARLQTLAPQLRDLQHWRRWGADQHREGLCADMERLVDAPLPLLAVHERLHDLRTDWKSLEKVGPRASQALWERFQQASAAVKERCRPFIEQLAKEHAANRAARESVCDQIEAFLAAVDWERVDWKRLLRAERETRHTWAAIGPTDPRHTKILEGRFRHALKQLDRRLDAERKRNQALKQDLITQVEALANASDLDAAIERTKTLQREWHTTVPARHKDENALWQSFRAACDSVFERRAALHQAHADEMREHLAAREAICVEAAAVAETASDPHTLAESLRTFERRWQDAQALPVQRQAAASLNERWRATRETLRQRLLAAEDAGRRNALDLLRRQAEICERLELSLIGASEVELTPESAQTAWSMLPTQSDSDLQAAIAGRFAAAISAASDPATQAGLRERCTSNGARLRGICLQLEILAGIDTPAEYAQDRLQFQVARLTERMVDGEEDPLQSSTRLLREWYLGGPIPPGDGLAERFARIHQAFMTQPPFDPTSQDTTAGDEARDKRSRRDTGAARARRRPHASPT